MNTPIKLYLNYLETSLGNFGVMGRGNFENEVIFRKEYIQHSMLLKTCKLSRDTLR